MTLPAKLERTGKHSRRSAATDCSRVPAFVRALWAMSTAPLANDDSFKAFACSTLDGECELESVAMSCAHRDSGCDGLWAETNAPIANNSFVRDSAHRQVQESECDTVHDFERPGRRARTRGPVGLRCRSGLTFALFRGIARKDWSRVGVTTGSGHFNAYQFDGTKGHAKPGRTSDVPGVVIQTGFRQWCPPSSLSSSCILTRRTTRTASAPPPRMSPVAARSAILRDCYTPNRRPYVNFSPTCRASRRTRQEQQ